MLFSVKNVLISLYKKKIVVSVSLQVASWQNMGESFLDYSWIQDFEADFP